MPTTLSAWEKVERQLHKETMKVARERVAKGTAFLDEYLPDWWTFIDINPEVFDMGGSFTCVWGQMAGKDLVQWFGPLEERRLLYGYGDCYSQLYLRGVINPDDVDNGNDWMSERGFYARSSSPDYVGYGELREAWCEVIGPRQAAARATH